MQIKKQTLLHIALIACFALLAMSSSFYNGVTVGNDSHQHFQFAQTIYNTISSGEIYPSFAGSPNHGYGDVGLRFYPPLIYYVLSIFSLILGNWFVASLVTFTLVFFLSGIGTYFWAREEFSAAESLLAAALYIFAPQHLNQIYNSFLLAEFAATALIPFCFLFLTRVCQKGRKEDILGLSIAYALLILTHLPMTIIASITFIIYSLFFLKRAFVFQTLIKLSVGVGCAIAASSFYWLRMATELNWVNHASKTYFLDAYDYRENFLFASKNFINFQTDVSVLWLADLMLLAVLLIAIPSIIWLVKEGKNLSSFTKAVVSVFFLSVFLTTQLSVFVWDNFSFLQRVQFPWRWLGIVSMSGAVFASIGIIKASQIMKQSRNLLLPIGIGFIFLFFVIISSFITKEAVFVSSPEFIRQIEDVENLPSFECWWTIWAKPDALQIKEKVIADGRNYEVTVWKPLEREFIVTAGNSVEARIATFYYPHWQAIVNGERVPVKADKGGAILIPLTEKESKVQLMFCEPYFIRVFNFVSLFVWVVLGVGLILILCNISQKAVFIR